MLILTNTIFNLHLFHSLLERVIIFQDKCIFLSASSFLLYFLVSIWGLLITKMGAIFSRKGTVASPRSFPYLKKTGIQLFLYWFSNQAKNSLFFFVFMGEVPLLLSLFCAPGWARCPRLLYQPIASYLPFLRTLGDNWASIVGLLRRLELNYSKGGKKTPFRVFSDGMLFREKMFKITIVFSFSFFAQLCTKKHKKFITPQYYFSF